jgi:hypothetical protein
MMLRHWYLDLDERKAAPVSLEAFHDLVEWYSFDEDNPCMSPPLALGWDIRRTFGAAGFPVWRDLMFEYEPPFLVTELMPGDQRTAVTLEQYEAALIEDWADLDRDMRQFDQLTIDAMARARESGWIVAGDEDVISQTEATLDDLAKRSGAKRFAQTTPEDRKLERWAKKHALDEAAYKAWILAGEPIGRALKYDRWKKRRLYERRRAALDELQAHTLRIMRIHVAAATTEEECEAADAEDEKFRATWHWHNDHLWPTLLETAAPSLAPEAAMPPPNLSIVPAVPAAPPPDLLVSSADFIGGFVPPEYVIDGITQRRYCYSMTAQTGVGKTAIAMRWMAHVVLGRPIGEREVQQGNVLYLAGENPDDVRARWLVLSREMGIDADTPKVTWLVGADMGARDQRLWNEIIKKGLQFALVIVDTAAAYNSGDDENSNNQAGAYARQLRTLTELPGGPCVVILCHPTKRAADDDLTPRGGGAFLAEVDGNMAVMRKDSLLAVVPFGKFRGDMSWSQKYEIEVIRDHPTLKDARGRQMRSVLARPVAEGAAEVMEKRTDADTIAVLNALCNAPGATPTDLARVLGWTFGLKGEPNVNRVKRNLEKLAKQKLAKETVGRWKTTSAGQQALNDIDNAKPVEPRPMFPMSLPPTFKPLL